MDNSRIPIDSKAGTGNELLARTHPRGRGLRNTTQDHIKPPSIARLRTDRDYTSRIQLLAHRVGSVSSSEVKQK
ncbi:hypothetical protein [Okeania sp. SIO2C2]|uniref:hypothetical protein n=1 Tax=Okeania sp. SIO2C2 TaxID=2607787 RepID=UPI00257B8940|nr:hypothetical protein [Okeania sp. SIO2C2]